MPKATIEIEEKVAELLRAQAESRSLPLSQYLSEIAFSNGSLKSAESLSAEEFERLLDENATPGPVLPEDFSRKDIYNDHD
jgi:hypothetical protein